MNNITKVSQITYQDCADYLRIAEVTESDINTLNTMINVAKTFIKNYTGQSDLDAHEDFVIAVFVLVQDMWDNRALYVNTTNTNFVVDSILGMHAVNLLPTEAT